MTVFHSGLFPCDSPFEDLRSAAKIPAIPWLSILIGEIAQILRQALRDLAMGFQSPRCRWDHGSTEGRHYAFL